MTIRKVVMMLGLVLGAKAADNKLVDSQQQARLFRLKSLVAEEALEQQAIARLQAEKQQVAKEVCSVAGTEDLAKCSVDFSAKGADGLFDLSKAVVIKKDEEKPGVKKDEVVKPPAK